MALGAVAIALAAHLSRRSPLAARGRCAAGSAGLDRRRLARRDRVRSRGRRAGWCRPWRASPEAWIGPIRLWYHMPLATRFAHGAHFGTIDYFDPIFFASFYPANSEVVHAVPPPRLRPRHPLAADQPRLAGARASPRPTRSAAPTASAPQPDRRRDRPRRPEPRRVPGGRGPQRHRGRRPGPLRAVAILVNAWAAATRGARDGDGVPGVPARPRGTAGRTGTPVAAGAPAALATAGLAAGLAAGTKLSFLAPVVALFVGLIVILARGARLRTALWFGLPAAAHGRLLVRAQPDRDRQPDPVHELRARCTCRCRSAPSSSAPGFSVFHYATDFGVWKDWFFPGLDDSFGFLWPLRAGRLRRRRRLRALARR